MDRELMAKKPDGLPTGVEFAGSSIRIRFSRNGKRCCETLAFPQTPQGVQAAAGLRAQVAQLAKLGMLSDEKYAELFPSSSYVAEHTTPLFGEYAQSWLNSLTIVKGTRANYLSAMNLYWMPALARLPLDKITPAMLRKLIGEISWPSELAQRTAQSRLNSLFKAAVSDELIDRSPSAMLKMPKNIKKAVSAFRAEEADAIIAWMYAAFTKPSTRIYAAYFEFAFFTGMRTGEIAGLRWDEIDIDARTAHVRRIIVRGVVEERTKTNKTRLVMLNSRALNALAAAKEIAAERRAQQRRMVKESPFVFAPSGAKGFIATGQVTCMHFKKALKALKIPHRSQYCTRHTYATMCLMSGMAPAFIAGQLGHSVDVLLSRYAHWIESLRDWSELDKLENRLIGTKLVQENSESP